MKCPHCGSATVRRGFRDTHLGKKQLYLCKSCKKKITADWPRMRFDRRDVMYAVKLYSKGMSSSKVQEHLRERGIKVSRWTIIKWYNRFS